MTKLNIYTIAYITAERECYRTNGAYSVLEALKKSKYLEKLEERGVSFNYAFYYIVESNEIDSIVNPLPEKNQPRHVSFNSIPRLKDASLVVVDGFRLPDRIVAFMRSLIGKKTIYIQHGRYTRIKRNPFSSHVTKKLYYYSKFFFYCCCYTPKVLKLLLKRFRCIYDVGFLYHDCTYWLDYHEKRGIKFRSYFTVRDHDFEKFQISETGDENSVLYIAQSIYEDGRCSKQAVCDFYSALYDSCLENDLRLLVRPHPRSNKKLISEYFDASTIVEANVTQNFKDELPSCPVIVTHHSALAIIYLSYGYKVIFFRINQEDIPEGLLSDKFNYYITDSVKELKYALKADRIKLDMHLSPINHSIYDQISELK